MPKSPSSSLTPSPRSSSLQQVTLEHSFDTADYSTRVILPAHHQQQQPSTNAAAAATHATTSSLIVGEFLSSPYEDGATPLLPTSELTSKRRSDLIEVFVIAVALIAAFIFNNVSWVYLSDHAGQAYAYFLDQFTSLVLILMQLPIFFYQYYVAKTIDPEEITAVPWKVLLIMGTVDAIYDCFVTLGSPYTPGPFQTILFQLPIPITMIISFFVLKKRFPLGQYIGGLIILGGAFMTVLPGVLDVVNGKSSDGSEGAPIKSYSVMFYSIGVLFYSGNVVYKEIALKRTVVNVWFLSIADSSINFIVTWFLIPLLWIPGLGVDTPKSTFPHLWAGTKCFFLQRSDMDPNAQCEGMWWLLLINVFANVIVNLLTLQLIRKGSAVLMQVVSGIQLPLCNLFYACTFIMTKALVTPMTNDMWIGLALVCVGFFIYAFLPLESKPVNPLGENMESEPSPSTVNFHQQHQITTTAASDNSYYTPLDY